jgi:hypothetical protein
MVHALTSLYILTPYHSCLSLSVILFFTCLLEWCMERNGVPETLIRLGYIYPVLSLRIISGVVCGIWLAVEVPVGRGPESVLNTWVERCLYYIHCTLSYSDLYVVKHKHKLHTSNCTRHLHLCLSYCIYLAYHIYAHIAMTICLTRQNANCGI